MRTEGAILGKPLFAAATFTQFAQFYALAIIDTFNIKCDKEQHLSKTYFLTFVQLCIPPTKPLGCNRNSRKVISYSVNTIIQ